jgi:hypothetical protein
MLHLLDKSLESFLRKVVPLNRGIDVNFDAPDKDWGARLSRPTVNVYLWQVRPNLEVRSGGAEVVRDETGRAHRRPALPQVDCRYLVTTWGSDIGDEHRLLGMTLAALLGTQQLPADHLQEELATVRPLPVFEIGDGGKDTSELWSALGGRLKPAIDLIVTATVDPAVTFTAGPDVTAAQIRTRTHPDRVVRTTRRLVGGRSTAPAGTFVRTSRGTTRVDDRGTFLVPADRGDDIVVDDRVAGRVPPTGPADLP